MAYKNTKVPRRKAEQNIGSNLLVIIISLVLVGAVIAGGWFLLRFQPKNSEKTIEATSETETEQCETGNCEKTAETDGNAETGDTDKIIKTGDEAPEVTEITGLVSYAGFLNNQFQVNITLDQYLTEGECKLTVTTESSKNYTVTEKIDESAANSMCTFSIAPENLTASGTPTGTYTLKITVTSGELVGTINEQGEF